MKRKAAGIVIVCAAGMALYAGPVYAAAPDSAAAAVNAAAEQGQEIRVESIKEVGSLFSTENAMLVA